MTVAVGVSEDTIYLSRTASAYQYAASDTASTSPAQIKSFHHSLPHFNSTPLHSVPTIANTLGISGLLLKCESSRLGLPAFKILGASWGTYRALCEALDEVPDPQEFSVESMKRSIASREAAGKIDRMTLFAATDGNHGRAVARMARIILGDVSDNPRSIIYVPKGMYETTKTLIRGEGAKVVTVDGDYDQAVLECWRSAQSTAGGVMVQDNAFGGYDVVPRWIVEGYRTLLSEVDEQIGETEGKIVGKEVTHIVTPIGVGSLGEAVVRWAKDANRRSTVKVIAVEPETAACLHASLRKGESTTIETVDTIMSGMCCGTVSPTSWLTLRDGIDCSVTVGDWKAHETVLELESHGIEAGPCGAGCLAGLRKVLSDRKARRDLGVDEHSMIVVLCTEGKREYPIPQRPSA